jgi:hypothetical protein
MNDEKRGGVRLTTPFLFSKPDNIISNYLPGIEKAGVLHGRDPRSYPYERDL